MESKLDKLFRDQLAKHEEAPSPQAWDQIQEQLTSKKKALWGRRLAVAASIILIATVGFLGYRSLSTIVESNDAVVSQSMDGQLENQVPAKSENIETIRDDETVQPVTEDETLEQEYQLTQSIKEPKQLSVTAVEEESIVQNTAEEEEIDKKENLPIITESIDETALEEEASESVEPIENKEKLIPEERQKEVLLAEQKGNSNGTDSQAEKEKVYPKVRIVYRANQDSKLVGQEKKSILDKGINKITDFSDEHLLTADRKTKLRNTKDDLLALNFSKLLNKSNKDLEN